MNWLQALILGIVQGLTEYLPVSSSGHLEIINQLFGNTGADNLKFDTVVHAATVLSTLVVLWPEISQLLKGFLKFKFNEENQYLLKIVISMIPVLIVGVFFKDKVEQLFGNGLVLIGCMLILTALLLTFSYYIKPRPKEKITWWDAFIIGLSQAVAVLPGLSRSGTTIATGLMLGDKKEEVAKFSFLMVIVPILGEAFLGLVGGDFSTSVQIPATSLIVAFLAAFITGCIACKWMLSLVKKGKLIWFAVYCAIVGALTIGLSL
ncbi:MAG: undecaprenyl-diphosphate phosphatase [Bacteroidota bacterium]|nr:undecaprenyl-diphosphate phosphatase [Bacteroidota bacterium]